MTSANPLLVLAAAIDLPDGPDAPDWVHLLPTLQGQVTTFDGRGPYVVADAKAIIAASFSDPRDAKGLIIDENHATDRAVSAGGSAPARGYIKEMQARPDGIWGRVEWTKAGRELVADGGYRGISPAMFLHSDQKTIRAIPRASLVNQPNLRGLTALHMESDPMTMNAIAAALGLAATATADEMVAAITVLKTPDPALQAALTEIGVVLGVDGDAPKVLAAAKLAATKEGTLIPALQSQVATLQSQVLAMTSGNARAKSEAFVDKAIADKRMGVSATSREDWISLHLADPTKTEGVVLGLLLGNPSGTGVLPPKAKDGTISLNSDQLAAAKALGKTPKEFAALVLADQAEQEAAQ